MVVGLAAVAGLVAFTPTEASAAQYWSRVHNRTVHYHFVYNDSYGRPVYVNEFGVNFRHGRRGRHITVPRQYGYEYHHYGHGHDHYEHRRHGGLVGFIFGN